MAFQLAGYVFDDQGNGINGATVKLLPNGSSTPDATTTTAADASAQNGYWTFTTSSDKQYNIQVDYQGHTRKFFSPSMVQFNNIVVGINAFNADLNGNLVLNNPATLADNSFLNSPLFKLQGSYDSNAGVGPITQTYEYMGLRTVVTASTGAYRLSVRSNADVEVLSIDSVGNLKFPNTGQQILGDFSNATDLSRTYFMDAGTNKASRVGVWPSGTATSSGWCAYGLNSTNTSKVDLIMDDGNAKAILNSYHVGSGTTRAISFQIDSVEKLLLNTSGNLTVVGTTTFNNSLTVTAGNIDFSSTAQLFLADWTNATKTNRMSFQDRGTNIATRVNIQPSGNATSSGLHVYGKSGLTNCAIGEFATDDGGGVVAINSAHTGSGTTRPLSFQFDGAEKAKVDTAGILYPGGAGLSRSLGSAVSVAAGAGAGTSPPSPVVTGGSTDFAGGCTFGTGTSIPAAPGAMVNITFSATITTTNAPVAMVSWAGAGSSVLGAPIITILGSANAWTGLRVLSSTAPAASQANSTYGVWWMIVGA